MRAATESSFNISVPIHRFPKVNPFSNRRHPNMNSRPHCHSQSHKFFQWRVFSWFDFLERLKDPNSRERRFRESKLLSNTRFCQQGTVQHNVIPKAYHILGPPLNGRYCQLQQISNVVIGFSRRGKYLGLSCSHLSGLNSSASSPYKSFRRCITYTW